MPQQFIGASTSQNVITFPKYFQSQGEKTQIALYMSTHTRAHTLATTHPLTCGSLLFILIKLSVICRYGLHFSTSSVSPTEKVNLPNSTQTLSASLTLSHSHPNTHTHKISHTFRQSHQGLLNSPRLPMSVVRYNEEHAVQSEVGIFLRV